MSIPEIGDQVNINGVKAATKKGQEYYKPLMRKKLSNTKEARLRRIKMREALVDRLCEMANKNQKSGRAM